MVQTQADLKPTAAATRDAVPRKIDPSPSGTGVSIQWSDGLTAEISYFQLRFNCPCASCVDEKTGQKILRAENVDPRVRVTGAEPIGRYAVAFSFSDGHRTGIYGYDRLRDLHSFTQI